MTSFELRTSTGHIKALHKAINVASRMAPDAILEFTPDKMRLCAKVDQYLVIKFAFNAAFFDAYTCDHRHRCFVNLKALSGPFKSLVLNTEKETFTRNGMILKCFVEDEINNQIVFTIGSIRPNSSTIYYRLAINDLAPERVNELRDFNRTWEYARVQLVPRASKSDRFLLSAFNSFAPDIDQVTVRASASEIKFVGTSSPLYNRSAISEFTHKRDDFEVFEVREDISITVFLRNLKLFLTFVETWKTSSRPRYIFEGVGQPAHFQYDSAGLFKAHFVIATPLEFIPDEIQLEPYPIPIGNGANESFMADENVVDPSHELNQYIFEQDENIEDEEDDLNPDETDFEDDEENSLFIDGNLDTLNPTSASRPGHTNSISGFESIRSEMRCTNNPNPERVRDLFNLDVDPDDIENVEIHYSSDEGED